MQVVKRHATKLGSSGFGDTLNIIFVISVGILHRQPFYFSSRFKIRYGILGSEV